MSLVVALNVSLAFLHKQVFHGITFQAELGDRIGLVGPNGSGKTTLLRLLKQEISPDSGEVRGARGVRIGYLPQDVQESLSGPLLQSIIDSIPGRISLANELGKVDDGLGRKPLPGAFVHVAQFHLCVGRSPLELPRNRLHKELAERVRRHTLSRTWIAAGHSWGSHLVSSPTRAKVLGPISHCSYGSSHCKGLHAK